MTTPRASVATGKFCIERGKQGYVGAPDATFGQPEMIETMR
jgi:hypothetical protein